MFFENGDQIMPVWDCGTNWFGSNSKYCEKSRIWGDI